MAKIGIDFGTSYSTVSWVNPKKKCAEVIRINGREKIPSVMFFPPDSNVPYCGEQAYNQYRNCRNMIKQEEKDDCLSRIISDMKRFMNEEECRYVLSNGVSLYYSDLIGLFLKYLKSEVEQNTLEGEQVTDVCLTYPVTFTEEKKNILRAAAQKAGFNKIILLKEPIAASMGYENNHDCRNQSVLVYDFGGGTFDLVYVMFDGRGDHITLPHLGDPNCGGENIDRAIYDLWDQKVMADSKKHICDEDGLIDRAFLKTDCMYQKEILSEHFRIQDIPYTLRSFVASDFRELTVTKEKWKELVWPYVERTIQLTKQMLNMVRSENFTITRTILIGGSSRISVVYDELSKILPTPPERVGDLDIAVANGAAVRISEEGFPQIKRCFCRFDGKELATNQKFCRFCGKENIRYDYRFDDI